MSFGITVCSTLSVLKLFLVPVNIRVLFACIFRSLSLIDRMESIVCLALVCA